MIRINLIPTKAARKKEGAILQLSIGGVAILVGLGICWLINRNMEKKIEQEKVAINALNAQINQLQSIIRQVEDYKKKRRDLETKINTIKDLNAKRSGPVKLLEEFTLVLPRKAWISKFRENNKQLSLEGTALDGPTVADFVDALRSSKFFYNVQLIQVQQKSKGGKKEQSFNINCLVNYIPRGSA